VLLNDADIASVMNEAASDTGGPKSAERPSENANSRIVIDNLTEEHALQINGPIGDKGWWEVSHLEIRNNKAAGNSIQFNHAASMEVFERLLGTRKTTQGLSHTRVLAQLTVGLVLVLVIGLLAGLLVS
jgi:hypothetical protein